jgi:hypothetical protein
MGEVLLNFRQISQCHGRSVDQMAEAEHLSSDGTGSDGMLPQQPPFPFLPASGSIGSPFSLAMA